MKFRLYGLFLLCWLCGTALVLVFHNASTNRLLLPTNTAARNPWAVASYGKLPLAFEINRGQTGAKLKFLSRGSGYTLYLTGGEAVLALQKPTVGNYQAGGWLEQPPWTMNHHRQATPSLPTGLSPGPLLADLKSRIASQVTRKTELQLPAVLRLKLVNANSSAKVVGIEELPGKSNYFIGNDHKKWRTNVANYSKVEYKGVYPGMDLVYYGNQRQLEHDFVLSPGADPASIQLAIEGASSLRLDKQGNLVAQVNSGDVVLKKPTVFQPGNRGSENPRPVDGRFALNAANRIGFEVGAYDRSKVLVIDPVLSYSSYLGGSGSDIGRGIAVDEAGSAYVTGYTYSVDFPTADPLQPDFGGGYDVFVSKLNRAGSALVYSTYLGGNSYDLGYGISVDKQRDAYITGLTASPDYPTANPLQASLRGSMNAFVTKLNAAGSALVYSTYLGGSGGDYGNGIAVGEAGDAYVTGATSSFDFPTSNPVQSTFGGGNYDAFIARLTPTGSDLIYSTYLGGTSEDAGYSIAVDTAGNAYVTGETSSYDFPTVGGVQAGFGGFYDAFVTKLNPSGSVLVYSSYLGGGDLDEGFGIAVDKAGSAHITGETRSTNFPTANALQASLGGYQNAFVAKLNPKGSALVYSTYLGGSYFDGGYGIGVDARANAYVVGFTGSADFPSANPLQPNLAGGYDTFVSRFNPVGSALLYSTFLGGSNWEDYGYGIAVDKAGIAYLTGYTSSYDFPTGNGLQGKFGGGNYDAFVAKVSPMNAPGVGISPSNVLFGEQKLGTTSDPKYVTLRNVGSEPLRVHSVSAQPNHVFKVTDACAFQTLDPGESCTLDVFFTPKTTGPAGGRLLVLTNAIPTMRIIPLSGIGTE